MHSHCSDSRLLSRHHGSGLGRDCEPIDLTLLISVWLQRLIFFEANKRNDPRFCSFSTHHVRRSANNSSDQCAKLACTLDLCESWIVMSSWTTAYGLIITIWFLFHSTPRFNAKKTHKGLGEVDDPLRQIINHRRSLQHPDYEHVTYQQHYQQGNGAWNPLWLDQPGRRDYGFSPMRESRSKLQTIPPTRKKSSWIWKRFANLKKSMNFKKFKNLKEVHEFEKNH